MWDIFILISMLAITTDGYNIWYSPSCSATFISITINHSSLLENMKGCNLNFSQRFSRKKKEHYSLSTVNSLHTQILSCQLVDIFNISRWDSRIPQWNIPRKVCENCQPWPVSSEAPGRFDVLNFAPDAAESAGRDIGSRRPVSESVQC